LVVHSSYAERRGFDIGAEELPTAGIKGAFGTEKGVHALVPSLELGDLHLEDVPALILRAKDDDAALAKGGALAGNIGCGFLAQFARVTFDYRGRRLVLEPRREGVRFPVGFGMKLRLRQGKVCIAHVLDGSPAAEAGLRFFDVLVSIDGEDCPPTVTEAVRLLRSKERVMLRVGRYKEDDRDVVLETRPSLRRIAVTK
jgi:hypothetical protein